MARAGRHAGVLAIALLASVALAMGLTASFPEPARAKIGGESAAPKPQPAVRPARPVDAQPERLRRMRAVKSWGYQLAGLRIEDAARAPYDLLIIDPTTGLPGERAASPGDVERLRKRPDGGRRLVVGYLSIGEAEDYRADYFGPEYLSEDAPEWLLKENAKWKGNRLVRFCHEGWQRTILGDEAGRSVYNSIDPSPLQRLVETGLDGIYLDRVDVYRELPVECPDGERRMVDFVLRIAAEARKRNPHFLVIMQNAEELLRHKRLLDQLDGVAREDLFFGADHSEKANSPESIRTGIADLKRALAAGRPVLVIDYVREKAKIEETRRRSMELGFLPTFGPRDLGALWLPGVDY